MIVRAAPRPLSPRPAPRSEFARAWRRFRRDPLSVAGLAFLGLLVLVALMPGAFTPYSATRADTALQGMPPSWAHPLGFDSIGRDELSRLVYGTRVALLVGLLATGLALAIGVTVGAAAGYFGGWIDATLSRVIDTLMTFPTLVLLIALAAVLGPSMITTIAVIGTTVWATYARVVRAEVLSLRERDFVLAARAGGATSARIVGRHLVPNTLGSVIVLASLQVGGIILLESALSFLGLGVQPPMADWGSMLAEGRAYLLDHPMMTVAPGVAISLTVLAFTFVGNGLHDALDPRQRR